MPTIKPDNLIVNSLTAFLEDAGNQNLIMHKDQKLDSKYLIHRFKNEGIGFVTKTLPSIGKHFDKCLQTEYFSPLQSLKRDRNGNLPLILNGLFRRVFAQDGSLLDNPCSYSIRAIRQVCYMFYKLEGDYPEDLVDDCIKNFVDVDESLTSCDMVGPKQWAILYAAAGIIKEVFQDMDPTDIIPRPGPGQTADKIPAGERYEPRVQYSRLHNAYPYYDYFYCNRNHLLSRIPSYRRLRKSDDSISRLAVVPKDSRGPRIICMEPSEFMWLQQGLARKMMSHLEHHPLTRGHVNFTDQTINGKLALEGSKTGRWATLDMKEASDRISKNLVELLFDEVPILRSKLLALTTDYIELPTGQHILKKKYAPMGSALCFPVMSVVHFALGLASIRVETGESTRTIAKRFYVYGDDLIVHHSYVKILFQDFPLFDLKFNKDKSCYKGKFRESCGIDAYDGINVTPKRVKTHALSVRNINAIKSHLDMGNGFQSLGYHALYRVWRQKLESVCGSFPYTSPNSAALGWNCNSPYLNVINDNHLKWNTKLQTYMMNVRLIVPRQFTSMLGGWEQLLRAQNHVLLDDSSVMYRRSDIKMISKRIPLSQV